VLSWLKFIGFPEKLLDDFLSLNTLLKLDRNAIISGKGTALKRGYPL